MGREEVGPPSERQEGLGRRVEEEPGEEAGDQGGRPWLARRGVREGHLEEAAAALHGQAFVTETTASMMQAEPPTSLRAMMSSIVWPGTRTASLAPFP